MKQHDFLKYFDLWRLLWAKYKFFQSFSLVAVCPSLTLYLWVSDNLPRQYLLL